MQQDWKSDEETLGTREKFWYGTGNGAGPKWLFKYPRPNTGEHWAEKIAAEVAACLDIPHATVDLATCDGESGSVSKNFVVRDFSLIHGYQMLETVLDNYDGSKRFKQSDHAIQAIWRVLDNIFVEPNASQEAKAQIAEYITLDALIGNTDRHHENWGLLIKPFGDSMLGHVAPSYDHASSLGRELLDAKRDRLLAESRIGQYVMKGRGAIYWSADQTKGPSPLELVQRANREYPELFNPVLKRIEALNFSQLEAIVDRIPGTFMLSAAKRFATAFLEYSYRQLLDLRG